MYIKSRIALRLCLVCLPHWAGFHLREFIRDCYDLKAWKLELFICFFLYPAKKNTLTKVLYILKICIYQNTFYYCHFFPTSELHINNMLRLFVVWGLVYNFRTKIYNSIWHVLMTPTSHVQTALMLALSRQRIKKFCGGDGTRAMTYLKNCRGLNV